jgi:hypothetical protein
MKAKSLRYLFDKIISLQNIGNEQRNRIQELKQLNTELQDKLNTYERIELQNRVAEQS